MKTFVAFLFFVLALAFAPSVLAYTPPTMTAHVTDTAHKLTEPERIAIDKKLEDYRLKTTNEIAVFIPATLDGDDIENVAFTTFRAWKLGAGKQDNGVLVVIAPVERKARIQTGKGVEGALPDLLANDIIRGKIRPNLTPGSENYRAAVDASTDAIIAALDKGGAGSAPSTKHPASSGDLAFGLIFFLFMIAVPIIFMIVIVRAIARAFTSNGRSAGSGWTSGSSWSNDSSWSSGGGGGGSDWGGGGGGGGDSGFSGGGGDTGGGGSSDSF
jgi:uncharacterized protein